MKKLFWMIVFLVVLVGGITVLGAVMAYIGLQQFDMTSELDRAEQGGVGVVEEEPVAEEGDTAMPTDDTEVLDLPE